MSFCFEVVITLTTKEYAKLLGEFVRFGCFTFGGGWSIIAQMQQLYVEKRQVITSQELLDLTSVAKSLPGVMIANVAMLYGYRVGGLLGGLVCVFGMCTPPMVVLIIISFFYQAFRTNYWVMAAMEGMQAAVVPIILGAAVGLAKGSVQYLPCYERWGLPKAVSSIPPATPSSPSAWRCTCSPPSTPLFWCSSAWCPG